MDRAPSEEDQRQLGCEGGSPGGKDWSGAACRVRRSADDGWQVENATKGPEIKQSVYTDYGDSTD